MLEGGGHPTCATNEKLFESATVLYGISRHEVEHCLTERIVHDLRMAPDNPFCSCPMDGLLFSVDGYDDDPRELFQIPEFREFIRELSKHAIPGLCDFLLSQVDPFMSICEALGVSQEVAETRLRAVCKSFGFDQKVGP